ncbi:MAG: ATP-dependent RecD-like DNA helicase, partial [Bacilli bacterium]
MKITGKIKRVTYYNEENGYGVCKIKYEQDNLTIEVVESKVDTSNFTVTGNFFCSPKVDDVYEFDGEFTHNKYGTQFTFKGLKSVYAKTKAGIVNYISSEDFNGIGRVTATKVYDALGDDTIRLIIEDPNALKSVDIKAEHKDIIRTALLTNYNKQEELITLLGFDISYTLAKSLIAKLGSKVTGIVKRNPYLLIDLVKGIGFTKADEIAKKVGIAPDSLLRLKSLILYILKNTLYDSGDTFMHLNDLYIKCLSEGNRDGNYINKENYRELIQELENDKKIITDSDHFVYITSIYKKKQNLARSIYNLISATHEDIDLSKIQKIIKETEICNKITYTSNQQKGISLAVREPMTIITGGPGTGKSTVVSGIIEVFSALKAGNTEITMERIKLAAPTGRAAKRLTELTNHPATTIHKLLGYNGIEFSDEVVDADLIIVDEFSMVDIELAETLFRLISPNTRIVLVGDSDQLPAIGLGDVLNDLILSKEITTVHLPEVHRQASDSTIIDLAKSINSGMVPSDILTTYTDRRFIEADDEYIIDYIVNSVKRAMDKGLNLIDDIQVLVPMYKVSVGINAINRVMQEVFNKKDKEKKEIVYGMNKFRSGDKVLQLRNDTEKNIMNGDIGVIKNVVYINAKFDCLTVQYSTGLVKYKGEELNDLTLAYAISIHKAQGSEFKEVILPMSFKYFLMLKRKLIYTAVTRAKEELVIIGNYDALRRGI